MESSRTSLASRTSLEDIFWSPWPWPWPRSRKSSKFAHVLGSRTALFLNGWNFVGKRLKPCGKSAKTFFFGFLKKRSPEKKFFEDLFFEIARKKNFVGRFFVFYFWRTLASLSLVLGLGLERVCPWPRNFFCVLGLGLEPCVLDSTSVSQLPHRPIYATSVIIFLHC